MSRKSKKRTAKLAQKKSKLNVPASAPGISSSASSSSARNEEETPLDEQLMQSLTISGVQPTSTSVELVLNDLPPRHYLYYVVLAFDMLFVHYENTSGPSRYNRDVDYVECRGDESRVLLRNDCILRRLSDAKRMVTALEPQAKAQLTTALMEAKCKAASDEPKLAKLKTEMLGLLNVRRLTGVDVGLQPDGPFDKFMKLDGVRSHFEQFKYNDFEGDLTPIVTQMQQNPADWRFFKVFVEQIDQLHRQYAAIIRETDAIEHCYERIMSLLVEPENDVWTQFKRTIDTIRIELYKVTCERRWLTATQVRSSPEFLTHIIRKEMLHMRIKDFQAKMEEGVCEPIRRGTVFLIAAFKMLCGFPPECHNESAFKLKHRQKIDKYVLMIRSGLLWRRPEPRLGVGCLLDSTGEQLKPYGYVRHNIGTIDWTPHFNTYEKYQHWNCVGRRRYKFLRDEFVEELSDDRVIPIAVVKAHDMLCPLATEDTCEEWLDSYKSYIDKTRGCSIRQCGAAMMNARREVNVYEEALIDHTMLMLDRALLKPSVRKETLMKTADALMVNFWMKKFVEDGEDEWNDFMAHPGMETDVDAVMKNRRVAWYDVAVTADDRDFADVFRHQIVTMNAFCDFVGQNVKEATKLRNEAREMIAEPNEEHWERFDELNQLRIAALNEYTCAKRWVAASRVTLHPRWLLSCLEDIDCEEDWKRFGLDTSTWQEIQYRAKGD